jgi:hypothetical protein
VGAHSTRCQACSLLQILIPPTLKPLNTPLPSVCHSKATPKGDPVPALYVLLGGRPSIPLEEGLLKGHAKGNAEGPYNWETKYSVACIVFILVRGRYIYLWLNRLGNP